MICPNHNGPMCTTCLLGGLIRCPVLGTPLPRFAASFLHWMKGGDEPELKSGEDMKWAIMLIQEPRWVWYRSDNANRWDLLGACSGWAIGSGCDYALGAMQAGASAQEAVRIASRLDNQCGLGVDTVRFK